MIDLIVFMLFFGALIGMIGILLALFFKKRKKFGKKHGFKREEFLKPHANNEILNEQRTEHSAEDYR